jgi:hypothetical protein
MQPLFTVEQPCPYCGEELELLIDSSFESQTYVEDCFVCCRPIQVTVEFSDEAVSVTLQHENE